MSTVEVEREIPAQDRQQAIASLSRLLASFLPGTKLAVKVGRYVKERRDVQNRALWGCAYKALQEQTGNDPEDLHVYFCGEFFGWKVVKIFGQAKRVPRRTTTKDEAGKRDVIDTMRMSDFYSFIQRRSAESGFDVPDPDPEWFKDKAV